MGDQGGRRLASSARASTRGSGWSGQCTARFCRAAVADDRGRPSRNGRARDPQSRPNLPPAGCPPDSPIHAEDRVTVELEGAGTDRLTKVLHAGDPDLYLPYRPRSDGQAQLVLASGQNHRATPLSVRIEWTELTTFEADRAAIEAEPNDSWQQANELRLGRDVYGSADDVDYLDNKNEGKSGLDWFRFEVTSEKPVLVYFQLDLLDRDVSANLRVYTVDPEDRPARALSEGQGPDGDRPRPRARALLQAHQPDLRRAGPTTSRSTPTIPITSSGPAFCPCRLIDDPAQAVEAGMHYIIERRRRLVRPGPSRGKHLCPRRQHARHRHALHRLPPVELLDRGQPGRPPQWLSDPVQVQLSVCDRPAVQLDHAALWR